MNSIERSLEISQMVKLYREGQTLQQIGDEFGVSASCVHSRLKLAKEPRRIRGIRKNTRLSDIHSKGIIRLRLDGLSMPEIAAQVGLNVPAVKSYLKRFGGNIDAWKKTVKHREAVMQGWKDGLIISEISTIVGINNAVVSAILTNNGVSPADIQQRAVAARIGGGSVNAVGDEIRRLKAEGRSQAQISKLLGMPRSSIADFCQRNNLPQLPRTGPPKKTHCIRGHILPDAPIRACVECRRAKDKERYAARRELRANT